MSNSDKAFYFWTIVVLITVFSYMKYGYTEYKKEEESAWWKHVRAEKEAKERCVKLGGIVRPGTRQGYTASDIYGGCDFPSSVRP